LHLLSHRHDATGASVVVGIGIVPCTGALLTVAFSLANDAFALGLAVVIAIGTGMAATLAALGFLAQAVRSGATIFDDHHHARWPSVVAGALLVIIGLFFLHGLTL
jgi:ABC-type nickel/cobalt efflux system permease component RcnA